MTRQIRGLIRFSMGLLVGLALMTSCSGDQAADAEVGQLTMTLETTSPLATYRLRDALFEIRGPEQQDVSSEDYPVGDPTISVDLATGSYQVTLLSGWRMEHSANGQPFTPIEAALVSPNPSEVTIVVNEVTAMTFVFVVNGSLINFGPGTLSIDIDVNEISLLSIDLPSTTLEIEGPWVNFTATIVNPNGTLFAVAIETWIDQGAVSHQSAMGNVVCETQLPQGTLPPGTCTSLSGLLAARNFPGVGGTLVPGPATARFELWLREPPYGNKIIHLDQVQLPVTLVAAPSCGNNVAEGPEFCDGTDLGAETGTTCADEGYTGGTLGCNATCDDFDFTGCTGGPTGWTCRASYYGGADGCDCGCGALDPDCADGTVASCGFCSEQGSCNSSACPGDINPTQNWLCDGGSGGGSYMDAGVGDGGP